MKKPNILSWPIPNFMDGFYGEEDEKFFVHTLGEALRNFEKIVEVIQKLTTEIRSCDFDQRECAALLDLFYGQDMGLDDYKIYPSQEDNYYYVLSMPQLRDVEFGLEVLNEDLQHARKKVEELKLRLWQLLPDFYRGHEDPFHQPFSYKPDHPYPFKCVDGSLIDTRKSKQLTWQNALEHAGKLDIFMPGDDYDVQEIGFDEHGDVFIGKESLPAAVHWTEMYPYGDMLRFAEDIIADIDPTFLILDPEGPPTYLTTSRAKSKDLVKVVAYWDGRRSMGRYGITIASANLDRMQLVKSFVKEVQEIIDEENEHKKMHEKNGPCEVEVERRYYPALEEKLSRLKAII